MRLSRVHPQPAETIELDDAGARDRLLELYRPPSASWLRLNLVTSISGSAVGSDGTSETLTNATDRTILGVIRELSDVVLVGAESVRAEGYRVPRRAMLAIVTSSGELGGHRIDPEDLSRVIVLGPAAALETARRWLGEARMLELPAAHGRVAAGDLVAALRTAGHRSIVCEGGPGLAGQLLGAGLVDELCLSTSALLTPTTVAPFGTEPFPERALNLQQLLIDDAGALYARWGITAEPASH